MCLVLKTYYYQLIYYTSGTTKLTGDMMSNVFVLYCRYVLTYVVVCQTAKIILDPYATLLVHLLTDLLYCSIVLYSNASIHGYEAFGGVIPSSKVTKPFEASVVLSQP